MSGEDQLGSLAQSARQTSLKQARGILIAIGILTALLNTFMFFNVQNEARGAIEQEKKKQPGMVFDQKDLKEAEETIIRVGQLLYGGMIGLGLIFIVLGVVVYRAPVACTVSGFVLYLAGNAVLAAIDPISIVKGIIVKVIIIVGMVKAIQAAMAYEREARSERLETESPHD